MNILLLNAGSSSLKCPLMESADGRVVARDLKIRIKIRSNGPPGRHDPANSSAAVGFPPSRSGPVRTPAVASGHAG